MRAFEEVGGVDLILLIGFMRIVSPVLIRAYPNRILNVHPSLLPEVRDNKSELIASPRPSVCWWHGFEGARSGPRSRSQRIGPRLNHLQFHR